MKTDGAEFKKRVEEAKERLKKLDELRIEAIKGHVLIEEAMDAFLDASLFYPDYVRGERLNFHFKGNLALSLNEDKDSLWKVFWAMNELRNKIAHKIDSNEIEDKKTYLRKAFIDSLESNQKADVEKLSDPDMVKEASILVAGLFGQLALDARGRRGIIDEHWKARSA
jgi:hypothetical protein